MSRELRFSNEQCQGKNKQLLQIYLHKTAYFWLDSANAATEMQRSGIEVGTAE